MVKIINSFIEINSVENVISKKINISIFKRLVSSILVVNDNWVRRIQEIEVVF